MRRAASTLTFPFTSTFAFTFALALAFPSAAHAFGAGVFGFSGKPPAQSCTMCHSGGAAPQVTLSGPSALAAGQTATYTIDIVTGASTAHAGFDIATSAGALATIAQTNESWLNSGEITHTRNWPKGSTIQLMFQLTAPAAPGPLTIFATALDSDGVDDTGGDGAASTTFAVDVQAPPDLAGADFAGAPLPDLAQVDAVSSATMMPPPQVDMGPRRDEPRWACDASGAGAASTGAVIVVLVLVASRFRINREIRRSRGQKRKTICPL